MKLKHILTGETITCSSRLYYKLYYGAPHEWKDITPERTQKQIEAARRFVKLGKLHRTKANLEDVMRTFGTDDGVFHNAISRLGTYIRQMK